MVKSQKENSRMIGICVCIGGGVGWGVENQRKVIGGHHSYGLVDKLGKNKSTILAEKIINIGLK